jgi:hypothetical protein
MGRVRCQIDSLIGLKELARCELFGRLAVELKADEVGVARDPSIVAGEDLVGVPGSQVELVSFFGHDV